MPADVGPLWELCQNRLRELGVEHHNKGVEAGMHLEILVAEFLAGTRNPDPEKWWTPYG